MTEVVNWCHEGVDSKDDNFIMIYNLYVLTIAVNYFLTHLINTKWNWENRSIEDNAELIQTLTLTVLHNKINQVNVKGDKQNKSPWRVLKSSTLFHYHSVRIVE